MSESNAPALTVLFSVVMVIFCFIAVVAQNAGFIAFGVFVALAITAWVWALSKLDV